MGDWLWNFDIDRHLNRVVPRSVVPRLRQPLRRLLGVRDSRPQISNLAIWSWAGLGGFVGIAVIEAAVKFSSVLQSHHPPVVIASFGAAAILEYHTIESPLAQPRNMVFGQLISAAIGVAITKLFLLLPPDRFDQLDWLAGALAVAVASFVMGATKTLHPPAGATALMAATSTDVLRLGWYLLPLVLLGDALMLATACLINNIQRQFPIYWWTPADLAPQRIAVDVVPPPETNRSADNSGIDDDDDDKMGGVSVEIRVAAAGIEAPPGFRLSNEERNTLVDLQRRLDCYIEP